MATRRTLVLDTAALLAGMGPHASGAPDTAWLVPPAVRAEVRPGGPTGRSLERALDAGLQVVAPHAEALGRIEAIAREHGESGRLSGADKEVLALALERAAEGAVELLSDDYAVQNLARALDIPCTPIMTRGIRTQDTWYVRCTGCGRHVDADPERPPSECLICGSPLKRTRRPPPGRRGGGAKA